MAAADKKLIDSGVPDAHEASKRRRERLMILFVAIAFALTTYFEYRLSSLSNRLPFVNSIFFFGLINFNIILLMILILLISRNVGKLVLERRREPRGSKLKTKLVLAFLSFTIIPTGILFLISSFYINSSFDKWFSVKIQNTLQTSLEITQTYYKNTSRVAQYLATQASNEVRDKIESERRVSVRLRQYMERTRKRSSVDGLEVYFDALDERVVASSLDNNGQPTRAETDRFIPRLPLDILTKVFNGETVSIVQHIGGADLIRAVAPVTSQGNPKDVLGVVAVTFVIPISLVNRVDAISSVFQDYKDVNPLKYPVKSTYFLILIMMTALIIFVSIWIGLYLARELTVPLDRLVTATQKVSQGDLDFQILNTGNDEIARLTDSFNHMTAELKRHRQELEETNTELADKRNYVETILNSVAAGVISVDSNGIITTLNPSAAQLLQLDSANVVGKSVGAAFGDGRTPLSEMFYAVMEKKSGNGSSKSLPDASHRQFSVGSENNYRTLTATVSPFGSGVVFVIDDTTYLQKAQREAAWREVARRIAHEIKNPLTPIKLSAQRIQKRLLGVAHTDAEIVKECTDMIIKNVDELRDMVNEFSTFARFPEVNPAPNDLNEALREVVVLYESGHREINFQFRPEKRLPVVDFDRDQIKRVLINLLDNAVAVSPKNITVETHYNEKLKIAVVEVGDDGPGMNESVRSRLFEPYFSTKQDGTGLGLAIVKRIISDHSGFIRVQSTQDVGTKFTIELPVNLLTSAATEAKVYDEERPGS